MYICFTKITPIFVAVQEDSLWFGCLWCCCCLDSTRLDSNRMVRGR